MTCPFSLVHRARSRRLVSAIPPEMSARSEIPKARRVVVKIGSRALASDPELIGKFARALSELRGKRSFILVSSGAIALGCARLGYRSRPKEINRLQAAAAAGQSVLMRRYDEAFGAVDLTVAQVLLTHADLADRERLNNAREALAALLDAGAVPIVNENDTVSTEEIRFGDNDQLAAMVVPLVGAELLVLLTDVEGVLDEDGRRISVLRSDSKLGKVSVNGQAVGSGGMSSKLDAARKACRSGAAVVIARAAEPSILTSILSGEDVGTLVPRVGEALRARKHWIAFTLRPRGTLLLDAGAVRVVLEGKSSLLPVGVLGLRGQFNPGDAVRLVAPDGAEVGRGLTRLGALDVARAAGKKGGELDLVFGEGGKDTLIVHKDDLVVTV
jgi:glutamate 5-kinase